MKRIYLPAFLLLLCSMYCTFSNAQKTLLWRISGKGLQKPSYLYGTMHLPDERLFNLGDSLYTAIEHAEGFALELSPDAFNDIFVDELMKVIKKNTRLLSQELDKKDFEKLGPALSKKLKKPAEIITVGDIESEKNKQLSKAFKEGKMNTFLDAYLMDLARRQGKWLGGMEDAKDQSGILSNFDKTDLYEILADEKVSSVYMDQLFAAYTNADLQQIDAMINQMGEGKKDMLLTKRNYKMAARMDSLSTIRSMVFAVGAAHLPGSEGVINLLRSKGFTVEPVFSSKKIKPASYTVKEVPQQWQTIQDNRNGYAIDMPGKAGIADIYGIMKMQVHMDIFNATAYMTSSLPLALMPGMSGDSIAASMAHNLYPDLEKNRWKNITTGDLTGYEIVDSTNEGENKWTRLLLNDRALYMIIFFSHKESLSARQNRDRFFSSFKSSKPQMEAAYNFTDSIKGFHLTLPAKPFPMDLETEAQEEGFNKTLYACSDLEKGNIILVGISESKRGYFISDILTNVQERKHSQLQKMTVEKDSLFLADDHYVSVMEGVLSNGFYFRCREHFKGNRIYSLISMTKEKNAETGDAFFNSFGFSPVMQQVWSQQGLGQYYSTWMPSAIEDAHTKNRRLQIVSRAYDTTHAMSYDVVSYELSKYYYTASDTSFWNRQLGGYKKDSIIVLKDIPAQSGNLYGRELWITKDSMQLVRRIRLLLNGTALYTLSCSGLPADISSDNTNKFFNNFRVKEEKPRFDPTAPKITLLLSDLFSTDSILSPQAYNSIDNFNFDSSHVPLVHDAIRKNSSRTDECIKLLEQLALLKDSASLHFGYEMYATVADSCKTDYLRLIADYRTADNYKHLASILSPKDLQKENSYNWIYTLHDSLLLAKQIYPALMPLLKDSAGCFGLMSITMRLLDSNLVEPGLLKPYESYLYAHARKNLASLEQDKQQNNYRIDYMLPVLSHMKTAESLKILQAYAANKTGLLNTTAINNLLDLGVTIPATTIQKVAANKLSRIDLYYTLKEKNKQALFPRTYFTQPLFAEGLVCQAVTEDEDVDFSLQFIKKQVVRYHNKPSVFYFYKINYPGDPVSYIGYAGPFRTDLTMKNIEDATGSTYWDETETHSLQQSLSELIRKLTEETEEN
jgi:uncharacterized protein YbaP (TraB family)